MVNNMLSVQLSVWYVQGPATHTTTPTPSPPPTPSSLVKLSYIPCAGRGCGEPTPLLITHTEDLGCHHYYETLKFTFSAPTHFYTWELGTKLYQVVEEAKFIVLQNYPEPNYHTLPLIIVIMTNLYIILVPSTALIDPRQDKVNTLCDQNIFSLNASSRTE